MLTFLRKVRLRLIHENRITRYLAYAIGEIILVVVGILIAIQLNTIKQQGDLKADMNSLLASIHRDLLADSMRLVSVNDYYLSHSKGIQDLMKLRKRIYSMENNEIGETLTNLFFYDSYVKVNTTYLSMISAGKMQYLEDRQLSDLIIQYYNSDGIETTTEVYGKILVSYDPMINESPNLIAEDRLFQDYVLKKYLPNYALTADTTFQSDFSLVMQEPWVDDFLVNTMNQIVFVFGTLQGELEINKELRTLIKAYIKDQGETLDTL